jgi:uncharacterized membrane protein
VLSPQMGQVAFRIAFFLVFVSTILLFFVEPGSAEFVVTGITLLIGLVFGIGVLVIVRRQSR